MSQFESYSNQWAHLLSASRIGSPHNDQASYSGDDYDRIKQDNDIARSAYQKDYDRLVFSHAFHKLNQKTQVHPLTNELGIHTRLTHSLEVSCIGRSLGTMAIQKLVDGQICEMPKEVSAADVGVIVQAACLAHDIGNPPFGHAGEFAIRDWFTHPERQQILDKMSDRERLDIIHYEGNAQGLRLLTRNEHHPDAGGMRLTTATLGTFMKYPWHAFDVNERMDSTAAVGQRSHKFGSFVSESDQLNQLARALHLPRHPQHGGFARHPLAYLLEAADDICYALIDLEDGVHLGMLEFGEVQQVLQTLIDKDHTAPSHAPPYAIRQQLSKLRAGAMMTLVSAVTDAFTCQHEALITGTLEGNLFDYCPVQIEQSIRRAKDLARVRIFNHPNKVRMELMANRCLHDLLDAFMPLAWQVAQGGALSFEQQRLLKLMQPYFDTYQRTLGDRVYPNVLLILDFITNMNDYEAYRLAQELQGHWGIRM